MVSSQLQLFARKNNNLYNFKCLYCGDSKRNKTKARGYLYSIGESFNYRCHNCGKSISFKNLLKDIDPQIYEQYCFEKFKRSSRKIKESKPILVKETKKTVKKYFDLPTIAELNIEHPARKYLETRRIPEAQFNSLYYVENFKSWTNTQKETFTSLNYDEPRIIIPLIYDGEIFGFQGRSLSKKSKVKYITIILDDTYPKVYGYDTIDWDKNVYILEGPFDSMFIPNSIAMVGADLNASQITNRKDVDFIFIYDNEKRKKEILQRMEKVIDMGHSIVIWPDDIKVKDVNEMEMNGIPVMNIIQENTFRGLQAKVKFYGWKRL